MASVRTTPKSPYYIADMRLWVPSPDHEKGGYWKPTTRTTKVPKSEPESVAKAIADEMEKVGREAATTKLPAKQFFETRVASLMRAAGMDDVHKTASWREYAERWLAASVAGEKSLIKYRGEIKQFSNFLGLRAGHDLRTIKTDDFDKFHKQLMKEGRTANTAKNTCKTVRSVFTRAEKEGYTDTNPGGLTVLKGGTSSGARLPFTREDMAAIFRAIGNHQNVALRTEWRRACLFGLFYGMRIGDAVNRSGTEIHLENGVWVIRFIPEKKRAKGMEIALPLVGELMELVALKGTGLITPRLAKYRQPTKPYSLVLRDSKILIRRREAKGEGHAIGDKSFHSWRHTANTLLNDAGVDSKVRQLICDHDDAEMNARYTHASVQTMADAIEKATKGLGAI